MVATHVTRMLLPPRYDIHPRRLLLSVQHCQLYALMLIITGTAVDQDIVKDVNTISPDIATITIRQ